MTTQLTPPQTPPVQGPVATAPTSPQRSLARTMTIIGCTVASVAIIGGSILSATSSGKPSLHATADVAGISALALDAAAAQVDVRFSPEVTEAELDVTPRGGRGVGDWELTNRNGTLRVDDSAPWFRRLGLLTFDRGDDVTLVLPQSLSGKLDADIEVGAGEVTVRGDFADADFEVSAGRLSFTGAARELDATVSAGRAELQVSDVRTIDAEISAGALVLDVTGTTPRQTTIDVSAGSATVTLPEDVYAVSGGSSAGSRTIDIHQDPTSSNTVDVQVSAGSASVRQGYNSP